MSVLLSRTEDNIAILPIAPKDSVRDLLKDLRVGMNVVGTAHSHHWLASKISSDEKSSDFDAFAYAFQMSSNPVSSRKSQKPATEPGLLSIETLLTKIQDVVNVFVPLGEYLVDMRETVVTKPVDTNAFYLFVIGNESCDLDSAMSAIALAFFLSEMTNEKLLEHIKLEPETKAALMTKKIHVAPLLQIDMGDKKLKSESIYYMRENRLRWEDVITM